ncbi:MAG: cytochrome c3 family protein, partial [Chloroflexi bacterium]|nr:cytochrome c3 family protein [Chloroflexota bacterium]
MHPAWSRRTIVVALSVAAMTLLSAPVAFASGPQDPARQTPVDNQACLTCHSNSNLSMKLLSGETLSLYVDASLFDHSVHGQQNMRCTICHTNISGYPHPPLAVQDARAFTLQMYTLCQTCHAAEAQQTQDSIHAKLIAAGNRNAATCVDCHTAHYVTPPDQPRSKIPQTCQKCHSAIYDQYKQSVHGAALLDESNPDVPTCVDCHGVHTISDPTTNLFRLYSPQLCAKCHADTSLMAKYSIST